MECRVFECYHPNLHKISFEFWKYLKNLFLIRERNFQRIRITNLSVYDIIFPSLIRYTIGFHSKSIFVLINDH